MASNKMKACQGPGRRQNGNMLNEEINNEINRIKNEIDLKHHYTTQSIVATWKRRWFPGFKTFTRAGVTIGTVIPHV
jgi:hypothetical protein